MVPIYDSDIAEERWSEAEWSHYELWERVEQRIRKHNRIWIAVTLFVFLLLSSIPIMIEQRPKWRTLSAVRRLGQEINQIKREAALSREAYRIRFEGSGSLSYVVETAPHCSGPGSGVGGASGDSPVFRPLRSGSLLKSDAASYALLSREQGNQLNVPGLLESFCYDPLTGSSTSSGGEGVAGFAVVPVNDLAAGRIDRLSVILLSGPSVDLSFE
jgi:hypothetical protein